MNSCRILKWYFLTGLILTSLLIINGCFFLQEAGPAELNLTRVRITRVVDGDTAHALMPDGTSERVRFTGVDAPEINHPVRGMEPFGAEAEAYTRSELEGKQVWLETDIGERDQYGRLLAYVWLSVPAEVTDREIRDRMFNARLLTEGYAVRVVFQPNVKYAGYFSAYEAEAREERRGLWGIIPD
jgi:micrococcal nuclease